MTTFLDKKNRTWKVELDAFNLDEVRQQTGIDLADLSAGGLARIESDAVDLVRVLAVLCREAITTANITVEDFRRSIAGESLETALSAVMVGAENFFPPKQWSVVLSNLETRRQMTSGKAAMATLGDTQTLVQMAQIFASLPDDIKNQLMQEEHGTSTDLNALEALASVTGRADIPSTNATDSRANAVSQPAA